MTPHPMILMCTERMACPSPPLVGNHRYTGRKRSRLRAEGRNVPSIKRNVESSKSESGKSNKYIFGKL